MPENTEEFNNPGYESNTRLSHHGEELIWCPTRKNMVTFQTCYQCRNWDGRRGKCVAEKVGIYTNKQIDIPLSKNEAIKAAMGATETDLKRERKYCEKVTGKKVA